jgi:nucleotide-binding universal stress UspA family protein
MTTTTRPFSSEQQWEFETPEIGGIVVGFDGSPASRSAIETASAIAAANGWKVRVVSVIPPMSSYKLNFGADEPPSEIDGLRIQLRDAAIHDAIGTQLDRAAWVRQVVIGKPAREIAEVADKCAANLIILGRSQRRGIERLLSGGTTTQVLHCSSVPVLLVEHEIAKASTVVVAVDFSRASARAASVALQMVARPGAVYLAYVKESLGILPDGIIAPDPESDSGETLGLFRRLLAQLRPPRGVVVQTVVLNGMPVPAITEFCQQVGADLLAVGTRGMSAPVRAVLGSVSVGLTRKLHIPVLIAPAHAN